MVLRGKGPVLVGVLWMEVFVALAVILMRLYTRTVIRNHVGWDDLLLVITWFFVVGFAALCTGSATYGMGVHADELDYNQTKNGKLLLLIGQSVISIAMVTSKCATSVFLMRIVVKKWHKAFLWFWTFSITLLGVLECIAVMTQYLVTVSYVMCSWSAVMDFVLAIFPWFALWGLNMKFKEKVNICLSLSLGIIAGICGIIRTTGLNALAVSDDYLYAVTDSCIWTNSEITLTVICVSIPTLRPLYRSIRGNNSSNDASQYNHISPYSAQKLSAGKGTHRDYALESLTTTTVHGKVNGNDIYKGPSSGIDDLDTRHILKDQIYESNAIHRTTEVDVSYEDRKGNDVVAVPVKARQHI